MSRVAGDVAINVSADVGPLVTNMGKGTSAVDKFGASANRVRGSLNTLNDTTRRFGSQMDRTSRSSGAFGRGIQNAAFQVGDFAVQVGGGTSAMRAMSMQLPQLLGGFGVLGAVLGAAVAIIGPLAQSLFRAGESAEDAAREFEGLGSALGSMRGQISTLASLQSDLNDLHRAQAGASAAGASAVIANSQKEFDARRQLIEVERTLLQLRSQDAQQALRNLQDQQNLARDAMQETLRNVGPGATDSRAAGAEGFAGGGIRLGDIESALGEDSLRAMRERAAQIKRLEAELKLVEIASDEAADALKGVFKAGEVEGGGPLEGDSKTGGGSAKNPLQGRLEALNSALSTEREKLEEWRAESLELLNSFNASELEALGVHADAKLRIEEEYQNRLRQIKAQEFAAHLGMAKGFFSEAAGLMSAQNKKLFEIGKTAAIASAIINTYEGITQALAKYPPPMSYAYAAATAAKGFAQVAAIKSQTFGGGGGGAGAASVGGVAAPAANTSPRVALTLTGSENAMFSKDQVRDLINAINEEVENGAIVRLA